MKKNKQKEMPSLVNANFRGNFSIGGEQFILLVQRLLPYVLALTFVPLIHANFRADITVRGDVEIEANIDSSPSSVNPELPSSR